MLYLLAENINIGLDAGLGFGVVLGIFWAAIKLGDRLWLEPKTSKNPCRSDENRGRIDALEIKMNNVEMTLNDIKNYMKGDEAFRDEVLRKLDNLNKKLFIGNGTKSIQTRIELIEQKIKEKDKNG